MGHDDGMSVAVVSIVASSSVAIASLVAGVVQHFSRLKHEKTLSFETRSWDLKAKAHVEVIQIASVLLGVAEDPAGLVLWHLDEIGPLKDHEAVMYIYADKECRKALGEVIQTLERIDDKVDLLDVVMVPSLMREKERAIDVKDFEEAARVRDKEKRARQRIVAMMDEFYDPVDFMAQLERLTRATRTSLGVPPLR